MISKKNYLENLHKTLLQDFPYSYDGQDNLLVIDLVTVMGSIYCKDVTTTARKSGLNLRIPVFNLKIWNENLKEINDLVRWVSGENFKITFIENMLIDKTNNSMLPLVNNRSVTLFSGGLDSLTGAFRNFNEGIESDYIGFINKKEEKTYQEELQEFYFTVFKSNTDIILINKPIDKKKHLIQSTRSLLYLALAIAKAFYNKSKQVYLYENGILSLNPTINNRFTTKTTHPKTIYAYNLLLKQLGIDIQINHPFIFSTKGEQIDAMDQEFKNVISKTFTCGSGRSNQLKTHIGQCGVCIPCLLRKISLAAYENENYDSKYYIDYDTKSSQIEQEIYRNEYIQNIEYFRTYSDLIRTNRVMFETKIKSCYYKDENYGELNKSMLNKFANEFERFLKKYAPD